MVRFPRCDVYLQGEATLTGFEPTLNVSRLCAIPSQTCARLRVRGENANQPVCTDRAELRSSSVRFCPKKQLDDFTALVLVSPLNAPEDSGRTSCATRTSLSACWRCRRVLRKGSPTTWSTRACGSSSTTRKALLDVPSDVTVHTPNPAVELLHVLYFHLALRLMNLVLAAGGTKFTS